MHFNKIYYCQVAYFEKHLYPHSESPCLMTIDEIAWVDDDKYLLDFEFGLGVSDYARLRKYSPQTGEEFGNVRDLLTNQQRFGGIILDILMNSSGVYEEAESQCGIKSGLLLLRDIQSPQSIKPALLW